MKLTKYEHACFTIEKDGQILVIDPGVTVNLPELTDVVGIAVTHIHPDHLAMDVIEKIIAANPGAIIFGNEGVVESLEALRLKSQLVNSGSTVTVGGFELKFFGHDHAVIYETTPCQNLGVMVDDAVYYPGDSFVPPEQPVKTLACPASAPWMKVGEAMDFIKTIRAEVVFPVHNGLLSDFGRDVTYRWLQKACEDAGSKFIDLKFNGEINIK